MGQLQAVYNNLHDNLLYEDKISDVLVLYEVLFLSLFGVNKLIFIKLIGTAIQWQKVLKILHETQAAIFCYATGQMLHATSNVVWAEVTKRPQFDVLIQILTFFQVYRELEYTLYLHLPMVI